MGYNEKNYPGANVVVVGRVGSTDTRTFDSGTELAEVSIAVGKGYKDSSGEWVDKGTDWYTLSATVQYASENWPNVSKGDTVRVDNARLELDPYTKNDGTPAVNARLRFGTLSVVKRAEDKSDSGAGTPF